MKHLSIIAAVLLATTGVALAQGDAKQPPAKQSAPSESSHAPGHDAQTGKPETGEKRHNDQKKEKGSQKDERGQKDQGMKKATAPK